MASPSDETLRGFRETQSYVASIKTEIARREASQALIRQRTLLVRDYAETFLLTIIDPVTAESQKIAWFWFNHFNVFWQKLLVGAALPDYFQSAIKPYLSGDFKSLLLSVITHPAMLVYLDNDRNVMGNINENLARELLELHTLGVGAGYVQADVQEVARILTGFGLSPMRKVRWPRKLLPYVRERGEFLFDPRRHDFGDKRVLGQLVPGGGYNELETLVDLLAKHPATARHVAKKLAMFLLGEDVPPNIVEQGARVFLETDGDLYKVVAYYRKASELESVADLQTFKDPFRWVISSLQLLSAGHPLKNSRMPTRWLSVLGQPLFGCRTPDGYDLRGSYWLGSGQLAQRFDVALEMVNALPRLFSEVVTPDYVKSSSSVVRLLPYLGTKTRVALANAEDAEMFLALLLSSPEFMYWSPGGAA